MIPKESAKKGRANDHLPAQSSGHPTDMPEVQRDRADAPSSNAFRFGTEYRCGKANCKGRDGSSGAALATSKSIRIFIEKCSNFG